MSRAVILVVAFVACAAPAIGQTVQQRIDFAALGFDANASRLVEADGNLATVEWLVRESNGDQYRLAFLRPDRPDGVCMGDWFDPIPNNGGIYTVALERAGLVHKLIVRPQALFPAVPPADPDTLVVNLDVPRRCR